MSKKNRKRNRKQNKKHNQQQQKEENQHSQQQQHQPSKDDDDDEVITKKETNKDNIDDENDETNKPSERSSLLVESKTKKQQKQRRQNSNEPTTTTTADTSEKGMVRDDEYVAEPEDDDDDDESSESSSDDDDDSLVLEGMLQRVDGVESSSDSDVSSEEEEEEEDTKPPPKKKSKINNNNNNNNSNQQQQHKKSKKTKKCSYDENDEITNVEFIFCDMNEKFFHGLKTFLASNPIHAPHSSSLSDLLIDNISVGTVISTDDDEHNVFGFASVLNITTHVETPSIASLIELCRTHCPSDKKGEMDVVLSGTTKRPAGFLIHDRMVNLPLEITEVLHKQLVLDMEWAVENAEGGEEERKSLNFGVLVRLAPGVRGGGGGGGRGQGGNNANAVVYKHFDDEVFATNAEFVYDFDVTGRGMFGVEQKKEVCVVIVMTRSGHERAMKELATMIHG